MKKIAIIYDWLLHFRGAENELEQIIQLFPDATLFSVIDFLSEEERMRLQNKRAVTTFIQKLPFAKKLYPYYLWLMPFAIEQLDLRSFDLIISLSFAVAKGVIVSPEQTHICYCYSPMRYIWDLQPDYLPSKKIFTFFIRYFFHRLRIWDVISSHRVDFFLANSHFIKKRIEKCYRREAQVIYPPFRAEAIPYQKNKKEFYLTASRLVAYKRVDLLVEAFSSLPEKTLIIIGEGVEKKRLQKKASSNVIFLGYLPNQELYSYLGQAKAFLFAAKEDFGRVPLEAMAAGTPVIAYGQGGVKESVHGMEHPHPTGIFFPEQTGDSIKKAIDFFEKNSDKFTSEACRKRAFFFSDDRFKEEFYRFVQNSTCTQEFNSLK